MSSETTSDINTRQWVISTGLLLLVGGTGTILSVGSGAITSPVLFGLLLLLAGIVQVAHAVQVRAWDGFFLYLLDGIVRAAVGAVLVLAPPAKVDDLMLVLSFYLFVTGITRTVGSTALEFPAWEWTAASGLLAVAVAAMLAMLWPS